MYSDECTILGILLEYSVMYSVYVKNSSQAMYINHKSIRPPYCVEWLLRVRWLRHQGLNSDP